MKKLNNPWAKMPGYFCFGCAPNNTAGVRMEFFSDGDEVVSVWKPEQQFQGWIDTLHGGIQSVLIDEICAWAVMHNYGETGVTSKMEMRFLRPISTKEPYLLLRATVKEKRRNLVTVTASIADSKGNICAKGECLYFTFPPEKGMADCVPTEGEEIPLEKIVSGYTG